MHACIYGWNGICRKWITLLTISRGMHCLTHRQLNDNHSSRLAIAHKSMCQMHCQFGYIEIGETSSKKPLPKGFHCGYQRPMQIAVITGNFKSLIVKSGVTLSSFQNNVKIAIKIAWHFLFFQQFLAQFWILKSISREMLDQSMNEISKNIFHQKKLIQHWWELNLRPFD